jgi:hypothetical protein
VPNTSTCSREREAEIATPNFRELFLSELGDSGPISRTRPIRPTASSCTTTRCGPLQHRAATLTRQSRVCNWPSMQEGASEFRRITLPRTSVNKGMKKDRGVMVPRPAKDLGCSLGKPDYGPLGCVGYLGVGSGTPVEGVVTVDTVLGVDRVASTSTL